jgi:SpoVK/Ycf46/Vps4 family AAA+-type ATPase
MNLIFREYPFKSNKHLDKNVYFEGKDKLIEYVDKFKVNRGGKSNDEIDYELAGVTFKASILLRGPPGCGKSCTIRGILNRTGRHGIIIPWTRIKTCSDFCSLFRLTQVNDKPVSMNEICFIFEDFDANKSGVLKSRETDDSVFDFISDVVTTTESLNKKDISEKIQHMITKKDQDNDELSLECVLNVLDGIIELHDAMVIFTTNHLEHIDPAFTRSGRIDYHHEFKLASVNIIKEMLNRIRKIDANDSKYNEYFNKMIDYKISPADVQNICFKYTNSDAERILGDIVNMM